MAVKQPVEAERLCLDWQEMHKFCCRETTLRTSMNLSKMEKKSNLVTLISSQFSSHQTRKLSVKVYQLRKLWKSTESLWDQKTCSMTSKKNLFHRWTSLPALPKSSNNNKKRTSRNSSYAKKRKMEVLKMEMLFTDKTTLKIRKTGYHQREILREIIGQELVLTVSATKKLPQKSLL